VFQRTEEARALWKYSTESSPRGVSGLAGATIGRSEAQVLRLSLTYAALSGATEIDTDHLLAALAFWDYCEASVYLIFGDATGDPIADRILAASGPPASSTGRDARAIRPERGPPRNSTRRLSGS
jgi:hypothetical protein